jgi:hypothetical protein
VGTQVCSLFILVLRARDCSHCPSIARSTSSSVLPSFPWHLCVGVDHRVGRMDHSACRSLCRLTRRHSEHGYLLDQDVRVNVFLAGSSSLWRRLVHVDVGLLESHPAERTISITKLDLDTIVTDPSIPPSLPIGRSIPGGGQRSRSRAMERDNRCGVSDRVTTCIDPTHR